MGMPARPEIVTTIAELLALPDDGLRHELLDGVHVVTPAPALRHQLVPGELFRELQLVVASLPHYRMLTSPADRGSRRAPGRAVAPG
jgi:hypothetical protein